MKLTLLTVGRLKRSPERELTDDYLLRAEKAGKQLGFRKIEEIEVESSNLDDEGKRLMAKIPSGVTAIRLDERGRSMRSEAFAQKLGQIRDEGGDVCFLIGGADGYSDSVRHAVPETLSLGDFTWPHRLARAMLAEQIYRAISILAGTPYHKD